MAVASEETLPAVEQLFPAERGPVVIVASPGSIFPRDLAARWRRAGMDVRLVSHWPETKDVVWEETPVIESSRQVTWPRRLISQAVSRGAMRLESVILKRQAERARSAVGTYGRIPPAAPALQFALCIAPYVRSLRPQFVFGMEAFTYGLSTAWCSGVPRVLMPWGGDVYLFADTTSLANLMVTHALRRVDLIVPSSMAAKEHIERRFGVPGDRIQPISWGADLRSFSRATDEARRAICSQYELPADGVLLMSVRRFFPLWGSDLVLEAFLRLAKIRPEARFILLGGAGSEDNIRQARDRLRQEGLLEKFLFLDGDAPLSKVADLMSVADIGISLMRHADMRSASILQAAAAGAALVLAEDAEYRSLERLGFEAQFVDPADIEQVVAALVRYADDPQLRREAAERNRRYVDDHEDSDRNHERLLRLIAAVCRGHRSRGRR
jgi:glycosyltransferase involved in cell wall biosynthesis